MKLYHAGDAAIEPIDDRDELEKAMCVNDEFFIPSSAKGIVKIVGENEIGIRVGDKVYFDPKMMIEIKELNLVIVDKKAILMEAE